MPCSEILLFLGEETNQNGNPGMPRFLQLGLCATISIIGLKYYMSLTAFVVVLLAAMAHGTLQEEIRLAPGYIDLTDCQQYCIAGRLSWDIVTDVASWVSLSTCLTKSCICAPESRATATSIGNCQKGFISCAEGQAEQSGAVRWVAGYCETGTVMTPTLSVSSTAVVTSPPVRPPSSARSSSTVDNPASTIATSSPAKSPSSARSSSTADNPASTASPPSSSARSSSTSSTPTQTTTSTPPGTNNHAKEWGPAIVVVILGGVIAAIIRKYVPDKQSAVQTTN